MIYSKLPKTGNSIFTVMTKLALENNAINLSQGFPDFNPPAELIELVKEYIVRGFNQYAPMPGIPKLREKISEKIEKLYRKKYNPEIEITITAGATEAVYTAITAIVNNGDEVILFEPAYDSYAPTVEVNGGISVFVPLRQNDFSLDHEKIKNAITPKTKAIILNSPHNPTGSVINHADIKFFEEITRNSEIIIISDEVYEHIVFNGKKHISISESEELSGRSFVISSFGKTYHSTGWKLGYCAGPEKLMSEFRKIHQFIVFSTNTPVQYAYADFMENENHYLSLGKFYQQKRDLFLNHLSSSAFKFIPADGTYFQLFDYSEISNLTDKEFASYLTQKYKVATIPLSPFYSGNYNGRVIRICFAKNDEVLIEAANRLNNIPRKKV